MKQMFRENDVSTADRKNFKISYSSENSVMNTENR